MFRLSNGGLMSKVLQRNLLSCLRYPRRCLTHNKGHFDNLFQLIGRKNHGTVQAAWKLLTAEGVPTNPERKTRLALCGASEDEISAALELLRTHDDGSETSSKTMDNLRDASSGSTSERASHPLRQRTLTVADVTSLDESYWEDLLGKGDRSRCSFCTRCALWILLYSHHKQMPQQHNCARQQIMACDLFDPVVLCTYTRF